MISKSKGGAWGNLYVLAGHAGEFELQGEGISDSKSLRRTNMLQVVI